MSIRRKLLDIVHDKIRFKHHSISAEKTYIFWIKHYIFFHNKKDLDNGYGCVCLPYVLEIKYPNAKYETKWQFLFTVRNATKDLRSKVIHKHHLHPQTLRRNIKQATLKLKAHKRRVASHIFKCTCTAHILRNCKPLGDTTQCSCI